MQQPLQRMQQKTVYGIIFALFAVPVLIQIFYILAAQGLYSNTFIIARELSIFLITALFLAWMTRIENEPPDSIGLHNRHWGRSIMLALAGLVACLIVGGFVLFIFSKTGVAFGNGKEAERYRSISPAVILLMVLRAGLVEEIFYRGYLMERLEKISGKWIVYFLFPLIFFGLWHFRQGLPGIILSFSLGAVLAFMYWKKRDLKANIITHFMVDFIPNLLLPLFSNE
jgi:membrane protease YdiL (CAAX protease family)